ncbi:MAG: DNA-processing protein DprA [Candidatus Aminicenantes bacterium]|nr:DNA-processing protein DprA [Candidatus Aminicenantes bacterium]
MAVTDQDRILLVALGLALAEFPRWRSAVEKAFPRLEEAFLAPAPELRAIGLDEARTAALLDPDLIGRAQKEFDTLTRNGYSLLTFGDDDYPVALREIYDPPSALYCAGHAEALRGPAVAVVGARHPSAYGKSMAERLAEDLARRGLVVVSGMARGIDTLAHTGALRGGRTVAVLGSGLGQIYPPENRRLFERIIEGGGAVVTEFPLGGEPLGFHFPLRNRIISGLSLGLVVVEATRKSGSLISAAMALEQGREVMAVPGPATSELSGGTNGLIRIGARLVESWRDVAEELPGPVRDFVFARSPDEPPLLPSLTAAEEAVLAGLGPDRETTVDETAERTGMTIPELLAALLGLEIKGLAVQGPGKTYRRKW